MNDLSETKGEADDDQPKSLDCTRSSRCARGDRRDRTRRLRRRWRRGRGLLARADPVPAGWAPFAPQGHELAERIAPAQPAEQVPVGAAADRIDEAAALADQVAVAADP